MSSPFLTQDSATLKMLKTAESVAASEASILIEGESGTGKELIARLIHRKSPRASRPFVAVNCAAMPDGLIESELFGYEKGAFTGAVARKPGRFEMAHTGTLLLDEVSELRLDIQAKLLRAIQEREVDPLGGRGAVPVDITNHRHDEPAALGGGEREAFPRGFILPDQCFSTSHPAVAVASGRHSSVGRSFRAARRTASSTSGADGRSSRLWPLVLSTVAGQCTGIGEYDRARGTSGGGENGGAGASDR